MKQRLLLPPHRHIVLSERQKADFAAMTDTEFRKWFYGNISFVASFIDPYSLAVPAKIVEVMDCYGDLPISVSSRLTLARGYYATKAYQRLFADAVEVAA